MLGCHKSNTLALVCSSKAFAAKIEESLHRSGISGLSIIRSTDKDQKLASVIAKADAVAVTSDRTAEVLEIVHGTDTKEIIEVRYRIDQGSLNMLRCYLMDLKTRPEKEQDRVIHCEQ